MTAVLAYAAMISGFVFPACLICAVQERAGKMGSTIGACVSFGLIVMALILI